MTPKTCVVAICYLLLASLLSFSARLGVWFLPSKPFFTSPRRYCQVLFVYLLVLAKRAYPWCDVRNLFFFLFFLSSFGGVFSFHFPCLQMVSSAVPANMNPPFVAPNVPSPPECPLPSFCFERIPIGFFPLPKRTAPRGWNVEWETRPFVQLFSYFFFGMCMSPSLW